MAPAMPRTPVASVASRIASKPTRRRMAVRSAATIAIAMSVLALTSCGGSNGKKASEGIPCPATPDLTVTAGDDFRFTPADPKIKAKKDFVVKLVLNGEQPHDFIIRGIDGKAHVQSDRKEQCVAFDLNAPGTYSFFCSVSGHEAAGMKGKIVVS